jgi:hypothetical protein
VLHLGVATCSLLLLGNTECLSSSSGRLGTLTSDLDAPVMTETSVVSHLLHALKIFSESGSNHVGNELTPCTVLNTSLSVEEPFWDTIFKWFGQDVGNLVHTCFIKLSGSAVAINLCDFADEGGESSTYTLDDSECEWDLVSTVDIGILHSQNVSELTGVF